MSKPKTSPNTAKNDEKQDAAQASRERELRKLVEDVEQEKGGAAPPAHESAHDFVERRMRETFKK